MATSQQDGGGDPEDLKGVSVDLKTTAVDMTGKRADGEPCTSSTQCTGGVCDKTKHADGYCTHNCLSDDACPGGGIAVGDANGTTCECLAACSAAGDCRDTLECLLLNSGGGVCDGPALNQCNPKTGTGRCTTQSGTILPSGVPGGCFPLTQILDASGNQAWSGLCMPLCVPGDSVCTFSTSTATSQCTLFNGPALKDDSNVAFGFKFKGSFCDLVTTGSNSVSEGGSCGGASQTTTCSSGLTCDPVATSSKTCQTLCTYNGNGSTTTSCSSGTCTDVLGLGGSESFPTGVCVP